MSRIKTPVARISFPHLFTPTAFGDDQEPKFSCALVFEKGTDISPLKKAALEVLKEKFGDKAATMVRSKKLRMPFRTDTEEKGYPDGAVFFNAKTKNQPGVVSRYPGPDGKPAPITDPAVVYPGAQVKAIISPFYYDYQGSKGISFALDHVQFWADDERFDSFMRAEDAFDADLDAAAPLDDLMDDDEEDVEPEPEPAPKKRKRAKKSKPVPEPEEDDDDDLDLDSLM